MIENTTIRSRYYFYIAFLEISYPSICYKLLIGVMTKQLVVKTALLLIPTQLAYTWMRRRSKGGFDSLGQP